MRAFLLATVAAMPVAAWAEDVQLPISVVAAEVFPQGARVVTQASAELPAGAHRIDLLVPQALVARGGFQPVVSGASLVSTEIGANTVFDPSLFDSTAQAAARARMEAAEETRDAAELAVDVILSRISALEASGDFLRSVGTGDALPSAAEIAEMASLIAGELDGIVGKRLAFEQDLPELREALEEADEALLRAAQGLLALGAPDADWLLVSLSVASEEAGEVTVRHEHMDQAAGWGVQYDVDLVEGNDARIELGRSVTIFQGGFMPWVEANLTLSTAQPSGQTDARAVGRSIAQIFDPEAGRADLSVLRSVPMAEPVMEADATFASEMAAAPVGASVNLDGPVVSYSLPEPVTVLLEAGGVVVALDSLEAEAERYLAASPRFDETAFVMADFNNTSSEPILPGQARMFRDGALVGERFMPLIAAGAEATLGFGPEASVSLELEFLDQQSGDRGIIRGRETREDQIRLRARNLGDETQEVRLRYAVPTSQQEDLEVRVEMSPDPDTRDADDLLGVMEWELSLAPGDAQEIELNFDLRWPEGQALNWRP